MAKTTRKTQGARGPFEGAEHPTTDEQLTLFLYAPRPAYASVCFESRWAVSPPDSFVRLAGGWNDKTQEDKDASDFDVKFLACFEDEVDCRRHEVSRFPLFAVFKCGPDFREIGRFAASEVGKDESWRIGSFLIKTIKKFEEKKKWKTLPQAMDWGEGREAAEGWLGAVNAKHKTKFKLTEEGKTEDFTVGGNPVKLRLVNGGRSMEIWGHVGTERHGRAADPDLLAEMLCWTFDADWLMGCAIGYDRKTCRFAVRAFHDVNAINAVTFQNVLGNVGSIITKCKEKVQEFKKKKADTKKKVKGPGLVKLRSVRVEKYHCQDNDKDNNDDAKEGEGEHERMEGGGAGPTQKQQQRGRVKKKRPDEVHREILRGLIQEDKSKRRQNGGKMGPKLAMDGYCPNGTIPNDEDLMMRSISR